MYKAHGSHVLVNLSGCDREQLDDLDHLERLFRGALDRIEVEVLDSCSYRFSPSGATVLLLLAESHASLHTYPEEGVAFVDVFTCGDIEPGPAIAALLSELLHEKADISSIRREP